jgi:hypothetical protein
MYRQPVFVKYRLTRNRFYWHIGFAMMVRFYTRKAKKNLREGARKMEDAITPAARVRREFQLGRPLKLQEDMLPLHPSVVWKRATEALSSLREKMTKAELKPYHAEAVIVFIDSANPDQPQFLHLEDAVGKLSESCHTKVLETLSRRDVIAVGMLFQQFDETKNQRAIFPKLLMPLNGRGMEVLKKAAAIQNEGMTLFKSVN